MPRAMKVCPCLGCTAHPGSCPQLVHTGRCDPCRGAAEAKRGTAAQRGYSGRAHRLGFRAGVLARDPLCTCTDETHGHGPRCYTPSTVADHHPHSRRELIELKLNPNDPAHGRGLCKACHDKHTAIAQPGGWNAR